LKILTLEIIYILLCQFNLTLQESVQLETEAFRSLTGEIRSLNNFRDQTETEKQRSLNPWYQFKFWDQIRHSGLQLRPKWAGLQLRPNILVSIGHQTFRSPTETKVGRSLIETNCIGLQLRPSYRSLVETNCFGL